MLVPRRRAGSIDITRHSTCTSWCGHLAGAASSSAVADATPTPQQSKAADKKVKNIASTFAPRASGNTGKNPAVRGSTLYNIFTVQAWICMALGGLLSFNVLFPSNEPDLWRLMGCAYS